jgi:hypothetical protein
VPLDEIYLVILIFKPWRKVGSFWRGCREFLEFCINFSELLVLSGRRCISFSWDPPARRITLGETKVIRPVQHSSFPKTYLHRAQDFTQTNKNNNKTFRINTGTVKEKTK